MIKKGQKLLKEKHGKTINTKEKKMSKEDLVLKNILLLVEKDIPLNIIAQWTFKEKNEVEKWASKVYKATA